MNLFAADFIKAFHKAREEPTKKYTAPQTESQEVGWISSPLVKEKSQKEMADLPHIWCWKTIPFMFSPPDRLKPQWQKAQFLPMQLRRH